jgi:hypothetical protein
MRNDIQAEELLAMLDIVKPIHNNILKNAEVYYNYSSSGSCSSSDSTGQQSTEPSAPTNEPVVAPEAPSSFTPSATTERRPEDTGKSGENQSGPKTARKNIPRKVSTEDYYDQINISINDIRITKRSKRMTAYLSLKDTNDKKFSIYLRCCLTSSLDETLRSIKRTDNRILEEQFHLMSEQLQPGGKLLMGRLRYNPRRFKIEEEHKTLLKSALLTVYDYGTHMEALFYLLGEHYAIMLTDDITEKQKGIFDFTGSFKRDMEEEE